MIDINGTVDKHQSIIPDLLACHGLTGCDTVATCYGIGKGVALKVLQRQTYSLSCLGDDSVPLDEVKDQATKFILACYGQSQCSTVTEACQRLWTSKVGRSLAGAPKLASLPPTNEAFGENVAHAHLQVATWRHALKSEPPSLQPSAYGWEQDCENCLIPKTVPECTSLAPMELLKLIRCSCESDMPSKSQRCG